MMQPRSDDIERFARAGYEAAQESLRALAATRSGLGWDNIYETSRNSWRAAAAEIISHINIVQVEQRTVVYVPEIRFKE